MSTSIGWRRITDYLAALNQPRLVGVLLEFPGKGESDQQEYSAMVNFLTAVLTLQGFKVEQTSTEEVTIKPVPVGYLGHDFYLYLDGEGINYFLLFVTQNSEEELVQLPTAFCPNSGMLAGWIVVMMSQIGGVNIGVIFLDKVASIQYVQERK